MQHYLNIHELVNHANALAALFNSLGGWQAVQAAGILSPIGMAVKHLKGIKNGEVMLWLMGAGSLIAAFVTYLFITPTHDPSIIAFLGVITFISTQPFYKIVFKPLFGFIASQFATAKEEVANAANPAAVPPEGLPVIGK
jgi:hypothetical protein